MWEVVSALGVVIGAILMVRLVPGDIIDTVVGQEDNKPIGRQEQILVAVVVQVHKQRRPGRFEIIDTCHSRNIAERTVRLVKIEAVGKSAWLTHVEVI